MIGVVRRPHPIDSKLLKKIGNLLPGVMHSRFDGALRTADDLCDLADRLFVIVDEINDFSVGWRQLGQAVSEDGILLPFVGSRLPAVIQFRR
jgi:hypothetical protein